MGKIQVPAGAFKEYAEGEVLITPGWHTFRATKIDEKMSKAGDSKNWFLNVECLTPEFSKRKIYPTCFNEKSFEPDKAKYQVIPFILALDESLTVSDLKESGITLDWDTIPGKTFDAKVKHDEYNGRLKEVLVDYAPAGSRVGKE